MVSDHEAHQATWFMASKMYDINILTPKVGVDFWIVSSELSKQN